MGATNSVRLDIASDVKTQSLSINRLVVNHHNFHPITHPSSIDHVDADGLKTID